MVGDEVDGVVDGVWGTGGVTSEGELAIVMFVFISALISPSVVAITFKSSPFSF